MSAFSAPSGSLWLHSLEHSVMEGRAMGFSFFPPFYFAPTPRFPFSLLKLLAVEMASQMGVRSQEGARVPWSRSDTVVLGVQPPMSPSGPNGAAAVFSRRPLGPPGRKRVVWVCWPWEHMMLWEAAEPGYDSLGGRGGGHGKQCLSLSSRN